MAKNKKETTILLIVLAVSIIAGTIAVLVIARRKKIKNESLGQSVSGAVSSAVTVGYSKESFPLKKGMYGNNVMIMQWGLDFHSYGVGSAGIDGKFGPATLESVRKFFDDPNKTQVTEAEWKQFYTIYSVNNNLPTSSYV